MDLDTLKDNPPRDGPGRPEDEPPRTRWPFIVAGFLLLGCCLAVGIPNLIEARKGSSGEASHIGALRTLTTAQALFREQDRDRNGTLDYARSLEQLRRAELIDSVFASGTKHGYLFTILRGDQFTWAATAAPREPDSWPRWFFVDESGVIRYSTTGTATSMSQAIGG